MQNELAGYDSIAWLTRHSQLCLQIVRLTEVDVIDT